LSQFPSLVNDFLSIWLTGPVQEVVDQPPVPDPALRTRNAHGGQGLIVVNNDMFTM